MTTRLVVAFSFSFINIFAQVDSLDAPVTTEKTGYFNQFFMGGLIGKERNGTTFSASLVNGYRLNNAMAIGVSVAYEDYAIHKWRTMPVSVSLQGAIVQLNNFDVFMFLEGGLARIWRIEHPNDWFTIEGKGGATFHPAIVCRITSEKLSVYFKAGYRYQKIQFTESSSWNPGWRNHTDLEINRLSIHIGIGYR